MTLTAETPMETTMAGQGNVLDTLSGVEISVQDHTETLVYDEGGLSPLERAEWNARAAAIEVVASEAVYDQSGTLVARRYSDRPAIVVDGHELFSHTSLPRPSRAKVVMVKMQDGAKAFIPGDPEALIGLQHVVAGAEEQLVDEQDFGPTAVRRALDDLARICEPVVKMSSTPIPTFLEYMKTASAESVITQADSKDRPVIVLPETVADVALAGVQVEIGRIEAETDDVPELMALYGLLRWLRLHMQDRSKLTVLT
jgi:hypothetical protein